MVPNTAGRFCRCWSKDCGKCGQRCGFIFRGDGGFCRWKMLRWCDHHEVGYNIGLAKNKCLNRLTASLQDEAAACFAATGHKVRWFTDFQYAARSWDGARRVIAKSSTRSTVSIRVMW